jgi:hypothetical protein
MAEKNPNRVKAGKKSRRKGSSNELAIAKLFKEWWQKGEWARTPSSGGWATKDVREGFRTCGDIITTATDFPFCVEAKKQEGWHLEQLLTADKSLLYKWWDQAVDETPEGLVPMVVFNRNHLERLVMLDRTSIPVTSLSFPHLLLRGTRLGKSLVIFRLSDLFEYDPFVFSRNSHD